VHSVRGFGEAMLCEPSPGVLRPPRKFVILSGGEQVILFNEGFIEPQSKDLRWWTMGLEWRCGL